MAKRSNKKVKKRKVRIDTEGTVYIKASFNNIIISVCNKSGQVISWASAGKAGFRGSRKILLMLLRLLQLIVLK